MVRKSVLVIISLMCFSCYKNYYYSSSKIGGIRPKTLRFRLAKPEPYRLKPEDQIDTTAIYIHKFTGLLDKTKEEQSFYRFFSNGRFVKVYKFEILGKSVSSYTIGYYRVENNDKVFLEVFIKVSPAAGDLGKYYPSIGIIKNNTLTVVSGVRKFTDIEWEEGKISEYHHTSKIYLKQKVDTLIGKPDW